MKYLTLPLCKQHLNIDKWHTDDDEYITMLGDMSEQMVATHLGYNKLSDLAAKHDGKLPLPVKHACLLLLGSMYINREVVTYGGANDVPHGYDYLLNQYEQFETFQG